MKIVHRPGRRHVNADALSREANSLCEKPGPSSLPCGGCNYCERAYARWAEFNSEIDDVVPLSLFGPFAESEGSPVPVRMVTRSGKNTNSSDKATEARSEPTAQSVPPEITGQSRAEAQLPPIASDKEQTASPSDPDTGPASAGSGSDHTANANEPTRGSQPATEEGITLSNYVASDFAKL